MTRQVTDQLYIELDYYYPEEYYVYIAEAQSAQSADLSLSCSADLISPPIEAAAALSVSVSQSVTATRVKEFTVAVDNLFSSSVTVVAQLAGVALLESQSTMTIAPVVNRSATITLDNLVNVSSQAQYTATFTSDLTATVTQTAAIQNAQFASATLATTSTIFVSRNAYRNLPVTVSGTFTSTELKNAATRPSNLTIFPSADNWFYKTRIGVQPSNGNWQSHDITQVFYADLGTRNGVDCYLRGTLRYRTAEGLTLTVRLQLGLDSTQTSAIVAGTSTTQKRNFTIAVSFTAGERVAIYVNDGRSILDTSIATDGWTIPSSVDWQFAPDFPKTINSVIHDSYTDYAWLTLGDYTNNGNNTSDSTTPIDTEDTIFYYDFNGDGEENRALTFDVSAALSSDAAISAQADANTKLASAALSADTGQTTQVTAVKEAQASLSAATTQTTQGIRVRFALSTQATDSTQTTVIGSIKQFAVTVDSLFTSSLDVVAQLAGVALLETTATLSAIAVKTADAESTQSAEFAQSAAILYTAGGTSNRSAEFAQSTLGDRIRFGVASQTSEFEQSTTGNKIPPFSAILATTATVTANIDKIKLAASDLTAEFAQTAQAVKTTDVISTQSSTFAQAADNIRVRFALSTQTVAFAQNTEAVKTVDVISSESSEFTQTTSAVKTAVFTVNNMVLFGSAIDADLTARPFVYLESTTALSAIIGSIKEFTAEQPVTGVRFDDGNGETNVGDTFLLVRHNAAPLPPQPTEDEFLIAFWAHEPKGTVIHTFPEFLSQSQQMGYVRFSESLGSRTLTFRGISDSGTGGQIDYKDITWSTPADGWNHYLLYQESNAGSTLSTTNLKLYINGVLQSTPSITAFADGQNTNSALDLIGLYGAQASYGTDLRWFIGAQANYYADTNSELSISADTITDIYSGGVSQIVVYWGNSTPDATDSLVRSRLYDQGYVDLGPQGTLSGLSRPPLFFDLIDHTKYTNQGLWPYSPQGDVLWRQISSTTYDPIWANTNWTLTQSYTATDTDDYDLGWLANTELTASFVGVFLFVWNVESEFTQSVTATRVLAGAAALSSTATQTTLVNGVFGGSSDLTAAVSLSATIAKTTGYASSLAANAEISAVSGLFELGQADLTDDFDLVCDFDAVPPTRAEAALSAEFTIDINASSFTDATVLHLGEFTQVCDATLIPPIRTEADLTVTASLTATIGSIEQFASLVQSTGTVTASASITRGFQADLDSEFTKAVTGQRVRFGEISISALHATVTAGDVINLDPFLTLTITEETRVLSVKSESRLLIIDEETRSLIIEGWE